MRYPLKQVYITQVWGVNPKVYARFGLKGHNGVDFRLHQGVGTPIYAPHNGKVIEARYDKNGYGYYLKIENDKEGSILAHLKTNSFQVGVGEYVIEGQHIADGGNTGFSTAPHLHWGYYPIPRNRNNGYSGTINQIPLMEEGNMPETIQVEKKDWERARKSMDLTQGIHHYLGLDGDHINTPLERYTSVIGGYKSQATDMRNKLKDAEAEINNRQEQVSRLKQQVLDEVQLRKTEAASLIEAQKAILKLRGDYEARIGSLQQQVDQAMKEKGEVLRRLAVLETENAELKRGVTKPLTLLDVIQMIIPKFINWLSGAKL